MHASYSMGLAAGGRQRLKLQHTCMPSSRVRSKVNAAALVNLLRSAKGIDALIQLVRFCAMTTCMSNSVWVLPRPLISIYSRINYYI